MWAFEGIGYTCKEVVLSSMFLSFFFCRGILQSKFVPFRVDLFPKWFGVKEGKQEVTRIVSLCTNDGKLPDFNHHYLIIYKNFLLLVQKQYPRVQHLRRILLLIILWQLQMRWFSTQIHCLVVKVTETETTWIHVYRQAQVGEKKIFHQPFPQGYRLVS